jgi:hypothetical protein
MAERSRWLISGAPAKGSDDTDSDTDAVTVRVMGGTVDDWLADAEDTHPSAPSPPPTNARFPPPLGGPAQSFTMIERAPVYDRPSAAAQERDPEPVSSVRNPRRVARRRRSLWVPVLSALTGLVVGTAALLGVIAVLLFG